MELKKISAFLDKELALKKLNRLDDSKNGLQVKGKPEVLKVGLCVDARMDCFLKAKALGCNLIICHHGLYWKEKRKMLDTLLVERVAYLKKNKISLYAAHLPIDCHPVYGNNAVICRELGIANKKRFGKYHGAVWGFNGNLSTSITQLAAKCRKLFGRKCLVLAFGKKSIRKVAVVSGSASFSVAEAAGKADCLITGETSHSGYCWAKDLGVNVIFGGHYKTETLGVKAVGKLLEKKFGIKCVFIDCPTGL